MVKYQRVHNTFFGKPAPSSASQQDKRAHRKPAREPERRKPKTRNSVGQS